MVKSFKMNFPQGKKSMTAHIHICDICNKMQQIQHQHPQNCKLHYNINELNFLKHPDSFVTFAI